MTSGTEWIDQGRRVLDALRGGLTDAAAGAGAATGDGTSQDGHSADCRWCPICQVAAVVRGERPELTAALADVLTATATALRAFAAEGPPSPEGPPDQDQATDGDPPPTVQRIEIA
jgi:hypothetical protein